MYVVKNIRYKDMIFHFYVTSNKYTEKVERSFGEQNPFQV